MRRRPRRDARPIAAVLAVVEAGWFATVLWAATVEHVGTPRPTWHLEYWVMAGLAALAGVATFARRSRPGAVAAIAGAVVGLDVVVVLIEPLGSLGPLRLTVSAALAPVLLAAVTRRARRVPALLVVALAVTSAVLDVVRRGNSASGDLASRSVEYAPSVAFRVVTAAMLIVVPMVIGMLLRHRDGVRRERTLAALRAEERLRVARELHDTVANHVTGIIVAAQAAGLARDLPPATRVALEGIEAAGDRALGAMARMVGALRSPDERAVRIDAELPAEVASPLAAVRAAIGPDPTVTLRVNGEPVEDGVDEADHEEADGGPSRPTGGTEATADVTATLHRITVEALTNARRYRSAGGAIAVDLHTPHATQLVLEITNPITRAAPPRRGSGFGLIGLRERAASLGGRLDAGPDGPLWRLRAELPR